ncbi:MAG: FAD:protein FMN transferase [Candidatus Microgenomates bacterium]|jgi:thiamine biosynthesis lipoprotein
MKQIRLIMGMPVIVKIAGNELRKTKKDLQKVFDYFNYVDEEYSPYKETSQVAKLNRGEEVSSEMKMILGLSEDLKKETNGYFDIRRLDGKIDPSGIVKGWAIKNGAEILKKLGYKRFYVDAGGDAEIVGKNWTWGIRNPFNVSEIVKVLELSDCGIATSGTYERGQHIYDPIGKKNIILDIVSLTVIGPDVFEADKFSTPAFAMGIKGIEFIEKREGLEGYMIDSRGIATMTGGFEKYVKK